MPRLRQHKPMWSGLEWGGMLAMLAAGCCLLVAICWLLALLAACCLLAALLVAGYWLLPAANLEMPWDLGLGS